MCACKIVCSSICAVRLFSFLIRSRHVQQSKSGDGCFIITYAWGGGVQPEAALILLNTDALILKREKSS